MKNNNKLMSSFYKAEEIVQKLTEAGFVAYFAGGWVRDFLMKNVSSDIDIATSATPQEIQSIFKKTVPIGLSFGVILVIIKEEAFEIATFREDLSYEDGRRPKEIRFSSPEKDATRRDFTINGMFYDPLTDRVLDYVKGQQDIKDKIIRAIGDPGKRFKEDKLRMIRAIRFSCKLGFTIEPSTQKAILKYAHTLRKNIAIERICHEFQKMNANTVFKKAILLMHKYDLLKNIFPSLDINDKEIDERLKFIDFFPECFVIGKILSLFPSYSCEEVKEFCKSLKISKKETHFAIFLTKAKNIFYNKIYLKWKLFDWAVFFSDDYAETSFEIILLHLPSSQKESLLKDKKEIKKIKPSIARMKEKKTIIKAIDLVKQGIAPGVQMGKLLKEAEKIAINNELINKEEILKELKRSPTWRKSPS